MKLSSGAELLSLRLKEKFFKVTKNDSTLVFHIDSQSVKIPVEEIPHILAVLDCMFFGILRENYSVQGEDGYLVFIKGQDRWAIRAGKGEDRHIVYLSRLDIRRLYYALLLFA